MRTSRPLRLAAAAALGASALTFAAPVGAAQALVADEAVCLDGAPDDSAARGLHAGPDHREMTASERTAIELRTADLLRKRGGKTRDAFAADIPVYIHVMRDARGDGDITDAQAAAQVSALNTAFAPSGFSFALQGVSRHDQTAWHLDKQSEQYRAATRRGGVDALNIWTVDYQQRLLGIATFPWDYAADPAVDGVRIDHNAVPGGAFTNYAEGDTAVHEVGHWLGLFHTFEGGCTEPGDEVSDTPAQAQPSFGCPAQVPDTCPAPGLDPIHNFMDYGYDACLTEFTRGQGQRMQDMFTAYRAPAPVA